jgi:hypothetical protein
MRYIIISIMLQADKNYPNEVTRQYEFQQWSQYFRVGLIAMIIIAVIIRISRQSKRK